VGEPDVKKTPSALKWLAERRARTARDLAQNLRFLQRVQHEIKTLELGLESFFPNSSRH
jgi:hypothetical protein